MSRLSRFIFGAYSLSIPEEKAKDVFNVLITNVIPFAKSKSGEGLVNIILSPKGFLKYTAVCGGALIFGEKARAIGLFALIRRYRLRVGMFLGAFIFAISVYSSSLFVWDVNVSGNESLTADEICDMLESHGFGIGSFIPSADTDRICARIVLEAGNLSFMKINMRGTVANVEIKERKASAVKDEESFPSNLVAAYDGQIEWLEVTGGMSAVAPLQAVRKGELLVSGVIDSPALGYRLVRARGEVYARVTLKYESEIPLKTTEKVYTGEEITKKIIKFFAKPLNLLKNTNIPYEKYDTIVNEEKLYLFGIVELPIFVTTFTYAEYTEAECTLTEEEATARARRDIERKCADLLYGAQILSRFTTVTGGEDSLIMQEEIYCIINIAEEVKIETN